MISVGNRYPRELGGWLVIGLLCHPQLNLTIPLTGLLGRREAPSLAHFVRSMVGLDRAAAQSAFSEFLNDRSLTPPQIRFVKMVIDQLTVRGVMKAGALYEVPFKGLHAGGPDALFAGQDNVIAGIFNTLEILHSNLQAKAG